MRRALRSTSFQLSAMAVAAGLFVLAAPPRAAAQNKFPGHGPDLLGVYPGMPVGEARAQLQKLTDTARVQNVFQGLDLGVVDRNGGYDIEADVTGSPNPPVVWRVYRTQGFGGASGAAPMSLSALLSGLHAKYGMETFTKTRGSNGGTYWWLWDRNGNPLSQSDPNLRLLIQCGPIQLVNSAVRGDPLSSGDAKLQQACYASYVGLIVMVTTKGPLLVNYTADLASMPLGYQAAMDIQNAKNAAAGRAQRDQINKANQNKITF